MYFACFIFYIFVTSFQLISGDVCLHTAWICGGMVCIYQGSSFTLLSLCPHGSIKINLGQKLSYLPKVRSYQESKLSLCMCSFLMPKTKQQESIEMFFFYIFGKENDKTCFCQLPVLFILLPNPANDNTLGIRMSLFSCPIQP